MQTKNKNKLRRRVWVSREVQGGVAVRCVLYWFFCLCSVLLFVTFAKILTGDLKTAGQIFGDLWGQYGAGILASVAILPLIVSDIVRYCHRFVGPVFRLQNEMQRLAAGEDVSPIKFRDGDHWQDLADSFNGILERIADAEQKGYPGDASAGNPGMSRQAELTA